jgi:hypothetical protein
MFEIVALLIVVGFIGKYYMIVLFLIFAVAVLAAFQSASKNRGEAKPMPAFTTIMPGEAVNEIMNGRLPRLNANTIALAGGEYCHYFDKAKLQTSRIQKSWKTRGGGYIGGATSFRLFKRLTIHGGRSYSRNSETRVEEREVAEEFRGFLYITNRRIVFVSSKHGFDMPYKQLTAVNAYSGAIEFQFGSKHYSFLVPSGAVANAALQLIQARRNP